MSERQRHSFGERLDALRAVQAELQRLGYYFYPVEKEHLEGLVTNPLIYRIRTQIKKRGFEKVAGKVAITFSGYQEDPREVFEIPEIRAYWRRLDAELPELPAVLTFLPQLGFNGPGMHLLLLGTIDAILDRPAIGSYDVHVQNAAGIMADGARRIHQAASRYRMSQTATNRLVEQFITSATYRIAGCQ